MYESRQALRDLLGKGEFADAECMKMTTRALINCLQRFPSDKDMIFRCLYNYMNIIYLFTDVSVSWELNMVFLSTQW